MDRLYYDGQCPLCRREVRTLSRLQRGSLQLIDLHAPVDECDRPDRTSLLRRLHLRTGSGRWIVGLRANVRAWSHTPYGFLFRPLLWPLVFPIADAVYRRWADRRYQRRYVCHQCHD